MEQKLLQALSAHYNAKLLTAEANLVNYFRNSAGTGGHPDVVGDMVQLIDDVAVARNGLDVLASMVQPAPQADAPEEPAAEESDTKD